MLSNVFQKKKKKSNKNKIKQVHVAYTFRAIIIISDPGVAFGVYSYVSNHRNFYAANAYILKENSTHLVSETTNDKTIYVYNNTFIYHSLTQQF